MPALIGLTALTAGAQDIDPAQAVTDLGIQINLLWVVLGAVLVIFMQAGFALVETGFCRAKHAAHVVSTNFAIFGLGFVAFFLVGWPLMFGGFSAPLVGFDTPTGTNLIGSGNWVFLWQGGWAGGGESFYTAGAMAIFLYMVAFMDTDGDDPHRGHGRALEVEGVRRLGPVLRRDLLPAVRCLDLGRRLAGQARRVDGPGPRLRGLRRFRRRARSRRRRRPGRRDRARAPHRQVQQGRHRPTRCRATTSRWPCSACFILLFGWFGFNAASTFAVTDIRFAVVALNTALAAAFGATTAMFYMMKRVGKPDPGMMVNGMLAGLVAITAPCAFVQPWAAAVIGILAAIIVIEAIGFIERRGVDDPVGAIGVHGVGGIFGVLCVGIFADGQYGAGWNGTTTTDVGRDRHPLRHRRRWLSSSSPRPSAPLVICTVIFGIAYAFFKLQNKFTKGGIRPDEAMELDGMDLPEMGMLAYPEFVGSHRPGAREGAGRGSRRHRAERVARATPLLPSGGCGLRPAPVARLVEGRLTSDRHGLRSVPHRHPHRPRRGQGRGGDLRAHRHPGRGRRDRRRRHRRTVRPRPGRPGRRRPRHARRDRRGPPPARGGHGDGPGRAGEGGQGVASWWPPSV